MTWLMEDSTTSKYSQFLFYCGIASPLIYIIHDIVGGLTTPNFSFISNTISDLTNSASRANYPIGVFLLVASAITGLCFGIGIVRCFSFGQRPKIFIVGALLATTGILNIFTALAFAQDPIGAGLTFAGIMHITIVAICAVITIGVLLLVLGASSNKTKTDGRIFRFYTQFVLGCMVTGAILSVLVATSDIPVLGFVERFTIYSYQIWLISFAWRLIYRSGSKPSCE